MDGEKPRSTDTKRVEMKLRMFREDHDYLDRVSHECEDSMTHSIHLLIACLRRNGYADVREAIDVLEEHKKREGMNGKRSLI